MAEGRGHIGVVLEELRLAQMPAASLGPSHLGHGAIYRRELSNLSLWNLQGERGLVETSFPAAPTAHQALDSPSDASVQSLFPFASPFSKGAPDDGAGLCLEQGCRQRSSRTGPADGMRMVTGVLCCQGFAAAGYRASGGTALGSHRGSLLQGGGEQRLRV